MYIDFVAKAKNSLDRRRFENWKLRTKKAKEEKEFDFIGECELFSSAEITN